MHGKDGLIGQPMAVGITMAVGAKGGPTMALGRQTAIAEGTLWNQIGEIGQGMIAQLQQLQLQQLQLQQLQLRQLQLQQHHPSVATKKLTPQSRRNCRTKCGNVRSRLFPKLQGVHKHV